MNLIDTKYLIMEWNKRPDGRKWKWRHHKRVSSIYIQIGRLEVALWYR